MESGGPMRFPALIVTLSLLAGIPVRAADTKIAVGIAGSVSQPGKVVLPSKTATLSEALERAGGIGPHGSDEIAITVQDGHGLRVLRVRGRTFYSGAKDYRLPSGSQIHVVECLALGLGSLSKEAFKQLEETRSGYLERKRAATIEVVDLFPQ